MKKEKIKLSYDSLWKYIIRPPRYNYDENTLGPPSFLYRGKIYQRKDYNLISSVLNKARFRSSKEIDN